MQNPEFGMEPASGDAAGDQEWRAEPGHPTNGAPRLGMSRFWLLTAGFWLLDSVFL